MFVYSKRVGIKDFFYNAKKPSLPAPVFYSDIQVQDDSYIISADSPVSDMPNIEQQSDIEEGKLDGNDYFGEYNLSVPFASQAPNADWGMPYQEACEEASLIMADAFFKGYSLSAEKMDQDIKKLVDWEMDYFGYYQDTTSEEVALVAKEYFGLQVELDRDVSVENIKKLISQNKLVLVPSAGRILPNPNFTGEGPLYHMLVIRGYANEYFITNDPGTRRGEEFLYKYDDLLDAVHDWPRDVGSNSLDVTEEEMLKGEKVMIIVSGK